MLVERALMNLNWLTDEQGKQNGLPVLPMKNEAI